MVNRGLGQHGVVLEERLPQRGGVLGDDDQLGLAAAEALKGGFLRGLLASQVRKSRAIHAQFRGIKITYVAESNLAGLEDESQLGADALSVLLRLLGRGHCEVRLLGESGGVLVGGCWRWR